ncbi:MAG TPA: hypothetical protein VGL94_17535 [Ktedonobacteraceae bacterium]|jgi:hypothetical protein
MVPHLTQRFGARQILLCGALVHSFLAVLTPLASGPVPLVLGILGISQLIGDSGFQLYSISQIPLAKALIITHKFFEPHVERIAKAEIIVASSI